MEMITTSGEMLEFIQLPGAHTEGLRTLLIDVEDQDEKLPEVVAKIARQVGGDSLTLVGIVTPEDEDIETWADTHMKHSLLALDNERENIATRIVDDALVAVVVPREQGAVSLEYNCALRARKKREGAYSITSEMLENTISHGRTSRSSSTRRYIAKIDYDGSLGGGQPRNPLRVNTSKK